MSDGWSIFYLVCWGQWPPKDPFWEGDFSKDPHSIRLKIIMMKRRIMIETYQLWNISCLWIDSSPYSTCFNVLIAMMMKSIYGNWHGFIMGGSVRCPRRCYYDNDKTKMVTIITVINCSDHEKDDDIWKWWWWHKWWISSWWMEMRTNIIINENDDDEDDIDDDHHHGDKCNGQNQITFCFPFPEKVHKPCVTSAFATLKNLFILLYIYLHSY